MSPVKMAKRRAAKVPLGLISPNEPVYGTRNKSRGTPTSRSYEGKENTPVRSLREAIHNAEDEQQPETSRSSNERKQILASQKRARSSALTDPSPRLGLLGEDKGLRGEDSAAGSQSSAPVREGKGKDILPDDKKLVKNLQITATADACSPSDDGIQSGVLVGNPDFSGCPEEHRPVACCSLDKNMASGEVAVVTGSKAPVLPAVQSPLEEFGGELSSGNKRSPTKTYTRRKASRRSISPSAPSPNNVLGMPVNIENLPSRDENDGIKSTEFGKSDQVQATVARATDELQSAYDKLYKKYKNLKTRRLADVEEAFDEQAKRIEVFSRAADDLVENLRTTNSVWEHQEEMIGRSRLMEAAFIECQNDLVVERARNLELRQHLEDAELRGSKFRQHLEDAELRGNKLLHEFLENTTQLTISNYGKSEIMFSHKQSGYEFKLEQNKISEEVGGNDALLYNVVSPGTILQVAPDWMRSEIVFDKALVQVFFRRIQALCGGISV